MTCTIYILAPYVINFERIQGSGVTYFHVEIKRKYSKCNLCGKKTFHIHDYRLQKVKDIPIYGKPTYLVIRKRRFNCRCGNRFIEDIPFVSKH